MNRHARRAVAKNKRLVASLGDISESVDKLQPFMTKLEELKAQLDNAAQLLMETRSENAALMSALDTQRAVYLRLFAQGMGVSLDTVVSMAEGIQAQLTQGETHGIENVRTPSTEAAEGDQGA
jgi:DNA repair ATPase RecN